ncbi:PASTA domain-containing protein [Mycolicibacterium pyrenivorans]|uniref:PASTA domain-containing protein n=1 Tax=Mycolicibacterium pyrenivorans TaxID=187102 RepID=UPI0021F302A5|nr:PASTA domain-containing protein [Mycolicibacterium pyrenivorans]MCV7149897.1 PASTA domain-containing protein [Mycolicibacterium pyrenivorans]
MKQRIMATVATTCALAVGVIGVAAPAAAARDGKVYSSGSNDTSWVMPDVDGMVLKHAILTVEKVTAPVELNIGTVAKGDQPVINQEDWVVCGQSPKKGAPISQETKKVTLAVQRPHDDTCA